MNIKVFDVARARGLIPAGKLDLWRPKNYPGAFLVMLAKWRAEIGLKHHLAVRRSRSSKEHVLLLRTVRTGTQVLCDGKGGVFFPRYRGRCTARQGAARMPGAFLPFSPAREPTEDGVLASLITPWTRARKEQLSRIGRDNDRRRAWD